METESMLICLKNLFLFMKKKYSFGIIECFDEMIKMKHSRDFILLELEKIGKDINEWVDGCSKMKYINISEKNNINFFFYFQIFL